MLLGLKLPLPHAEKSAAPAAAGARAPSAAATTTPPSAATAASRCCSRLATLAAWRRYADARPRKMTRALSADVLELPGGAAPIELLGD